ncbi:MAG: succinylglutamate desuccinylase/aspartoacylase family protein [Cyanobacteria bacterium REEB459]|nr:succinylglutamate desuccinylase/aspartoacylase family protein [Cyanobacteria bacterium REEB459]
MVVAPTTYTGDTLQGVPVISHLNLEDLPPGQTHRFFFQGVAMGTGQYWYVPLLVARGVRPGPRLGLIAGVHGDELSSLRAVQQVMAALDPTAMAGSAIAVLGLSRAALEFTQAHWPMAYGGGRSVDMNRVWPGDDHGDTPASRHAALLWQRLLQPNLDRAIDFHTVSTGSDFTLFIYADLSQPDLRQMAELFPVEQIKDDAGEQGTLEMALIQAGIPALTLEIGSPRIFDHPQIALAVEGTLNLFKHYQIIEAPLGRTAQDVGTFYGNAFETIRSSTGGFLELLVDIQARVSPGQVVARQYNAFGDQVGEYRATVTGQVATIARDALSEPGSRIMQILYQHPQPHPLGLQPPLDPAG